MSGTANVLGPPGESGRALLSMARRETTNATRRISAADKLMAAPCGIVLPSLAEVPAERRFHADDREVIALAEILVKSDIATAEDWSNSERDATKYLLLTLRRWIRIHGGSAIDRRFDLDLSLSDRLLDYSDQRGPEGSFYLIVDPDSAAFVLLTPTIDLLEKVNPRLPATFYNHFAGALNRWVRVYDYQDAEERVDMLREWYEGEQNADQYELPEIEDRRGLQSSPTNANVKQRKGQVFDVYRTVVDGGTSPAVPSLSFFSFASATYLLSPLDPPLHLFANLFSPVFTRVLLCLLFPPTLSP